VRIAALLWHLIVVVVDRYHQQTHVQAWFAAGVFVAVAVPLTLWDVAMHLRHWHKPELQKHIVRIMLMVGFGYRREHAYRHTYINTYTRNALFPLALLPSLSPSVVQVPIYAVDSWFGLRFPDSSIFFDTARETYEAYVIYNFYVSWQL
jgi:hypothetical protein